MSVPKTAQRDSEGAPARVPLKLEYRTPAQLERKAPVPRQRLPRWALVTAGIVGTVVAVVRWRTGDWYAYVGEGPDRWAKFELPLWFQFAESSIVGLLATAALLLVMRLIYKLIRARRRA